MTPVPFGKRYRKIGHIGSFEMPIDTEVMVVGYYASTDHEADDWVSVIKTAPETGGDVVPRTFRRWHLDESFSPLADKWEVGKVYQYKNQSNRWLCKFVDTDGYAFMREDMFGTAGAASFEPGERKDYREVTH